MSRIVAVLSQDPGVGKTTTAFALAQAFALGGQGCLFVDVDPAGGATRLAGLARPNSGLLQKIIQGEEPVAKSGLLVRSFDVGLDIIPSDATIAAFEPSAGAHGRFAEALAVFRLQYPWIVLDAPPSRDGWARSALMAASHVVVPIQAELFAREHASQILDFVEDVVADRDDAPAILLLFTMVRDFDSLSADVLRDLGAIHGSRLAQTVIPRDPAIPEAASLGRTLLQHDFESRAARAYVQFAKELMNHDRAQTR